jgi:hypothetical protein
MTPGSLNLYRQRSTSILFDTESATVNTKSIFKRCHTRCYGRYKILITSFVLITRQCVYMYFWLETSIKRIFMSATCICADRLLLPHQLEAELSPAWATPTASRSCPTAAAQTRTPTLSPPQVGHCPAVSDYLKVIACCILWHSKISHDYFTLYSAASLKICQLYFAKVFCICMAPLHASANSYLKMLYGI